MSGSTSATPSGLGSTTSGAEGSGPSVVAVGAGVGASLGAALLAALAALAWQMRRNRVLRGELERFQYYPGGQAGVHGVRQQGYGAVGAGGPLVVEEKQGGY